MTREDADSVRPLTPDELRWMKELNREGARRSLPNWPLPEEVILGYNCWLSYYAGGMTPAQALDANFGATITVTIESAEVRLIQQFLAITHDESACSHGALDLPQLAAMLLEDVALMVRRPGSWEGSNMAQVMASHGYEF